MNSTNNIQVRFGRALVWFVIGTQIGALPLRALAQVAPVTGTRTTVYSTVTGVPVVNINTANSAGVSVNLYNRFNVNSNGLVLNNGTMAQLSQSTKLGGVVMANPNLSRAASLILNEVVTPSRSLLNGHIEVSGAAADVVLSNPYGITCSGCGFINTPRVTLTTGSPVLDASGALTGLSVQQGDILINGAGLDGSTTNILDLVTRSITVNGQVNGQDLGLIAGSNQYNYVTRRATAQAVASAPSVFAIDSSALGGMYAGRISLVSTEAGVGVRMLGNAAATAADFSINAAGKVEFGNNAVSANRDLTLSSSASGIGAITLTNAQLSAQRNLAFNASGGGATLEGGSLVAQGALSMAAASLSDSAMSGSSAEQHMRTGHQSVTITVPGAVNLAGVTYSTGINGPLNAQLGSLNLDPVAVTALSSGSTLNIATTGDMTIGGGSLIAPGDITLTAGGTMRVGQGQYHAVESTKGNVALTAAAGLINSGVINADVGALNLQVDGTISNAGQLGGNSRLTVTDRLQSGSENLVNNGMMFSNGSLSIEAAQFKNTNVIQAAQLDINAISLNNAGILAATDNAFVQADSTLTNSGKLLAVGNLNIQAHTSGMNLDNTGLIASGNQLTIGAASGVPSVGAIKVGSTGIIRAGNVRLVADNVNLDDGALVTSTRGLSLAANTLIMAGANTRIRGATTGGSSTVSTTTALTNNGLISSGGDLTLNTPNLTNTNTAAIAALGTLLVSAGNGNITNAGELYAGTQLNATANGTITNVGTLTGGVGSIDSGGDISLTAKTLVNNSLITASRNLTVSADTIRNEVLGGDTRVWGGTGNTAPLGATVQDNGITNGRTGWLDADTYTRHYFQTDWTNAQYYAGGTPTFKPQMVAGSSLTLKDFDSVKNIGGVISASIVNLSGINENATVLNDDLSLQQQHYKQNWDIYTHIIALGPLSYVNNETSTPTYTTTTASSIGAGIFANTLNASGFALTNSGSPSASLPHNVSTLINAGTNTVATPRVGLFPSEVSATLLNFGGLSLPVPTNPNGYFVISPTPQSSYLIAANPGYGVGSRSAGSDYLLNQLYGDTPTNTTKKLGDAAYADYLIRQQVIAQTGNTLINGYSSADKQLVALVTNAAQQAGVLDLIIGQAPTASQLAHLTQDIVWMVNQLVDGQTVLAPVVYLSAATIASINLGAVISAKTSTMKLSALTNTGGVIVGSDVISIETQGDITNKSGIIEGGNVDLAITHGSLINQTLIEGINGLSTFNDKTASIIARGNLRIDTDKDFINQAGSITVGGNASIATGGNLSMTSAAIDSTRTTHSSESNVDQANSREQITKTVKQIGSTINIAGNAAIHTGGDTTLSASQFIVGGNLALAASRSVNLLSGKNSSNSHEESYTSGFGVGGSLYGSETSVKEEQDSINVGSFLKVGGNASLVSGQSLNIRGSDLQVIGNAEIQAGDIEILSGLNSHSKQTTITSLSVLPGSGLDVDAVQSSNHSETKTAILQDRYTDSASASASVGATNAIKLFDSNTTSTKTLDQIAVASHVVAGGTLIVRVANDMLLKGVQLSAKGALELSAGNAIQVLTSQDIHTKSKTVNDISFTMSSANEASAQGQAYVSDAGKAGTASVSAEGSLSNDNFAGLAINQQQKNSFTLTNNASELVSGANIILNSGGTLSLQNARVEATSDVTMAGHNISILAANDVHQVSDIANTTLFGQYVVNGVSASASAQAQASITGATASLQAQSGVKAGTGLEIGNLSSNSSELDVTSQVSTIRAGGNVSRTAQNALLDVGTQIAAAGNIVQSAQTIISQAAYNTIDKSSSARSDIARIGYEASADASAGAGAGVGLQMIGAQANAGAQAVYGTSISYGGSAKRTSSHESDAVVGALQAGGAVTSTSTGQTTLVGTQLVSGGDTAIVASAFDDQVALSSVSLTSSTDSTNVGVQVMTGVGAGASAGAAPGLSGVKGGGGAGAGAQQSVSMSFDHSQQTTTQSVSQSTVGNILAGGNVSVIASRGALNLVGTGITAAGNVQLAAALDLNAAAAANTKADNMTGWNVNANLNVQGVEGFGGDVSTQFGMGFGIQGASESTSKSVVSKISAGKNLTVTAGANVLLTGTQISAEKTLNIIAAGDVALAVAEDTSKSDDNTYGMSSTTTGTKRGKSGSDSTKREESGSDSMTSSTGDNVKDSASSTTWNATRLTGAHVSVQAGRNFSQQNNVVVLDDVKAAGTVTSTTVKDTSTVSSVGFITNNGVAAGMQSKSTFESIKPKVEQGKTASTNVSKSTLVMQVGSDHVTTAAAENLARAKGAQHVILKADGTLIGDVNPGITNVSVVGHQNTEDGTLGGMDASGIANGLNRVGSPTKIELVGCGTDCMVPRIKDALGAKGIPVDVTGYSGPVKVDVNGNVLSVAKNDPESLARGSANQLSPIRKALKTSPAQGDTTTTAVTKVMQESASKSNSSIAEGNGSAEVAAMGISDSVSDNVGGTSQITAPPKTYQSAETTKQSAKRIATNAGHTVAGEAIGTLIPTAIRDVAAIGYEVTKSTVPNEVALAFSIAQAGYSVIKHAIGAGINAYDFAKANKATNANLAESLRTAGVMDDAGLKAAGASFYIKTEGDDGEKPQHRIFTQTGKVDPSLTFTEQLSGSKLRAAASAYMEAKNSDSVKVKALSEFMENYRQEKRQQKVVLAKVLGAHALNLLLVGGATAGLDAPNSKNTDNSNAGYAFEGAAKNLIYTDIKAVAKTLFPVRTTLVDSNGNDFKTSKAPSPQSKRDIGLQALEYSANQTVEGYIAGQTWGHPSYVIQRGVDPLLNFGGEIVNSLTGLGISEFHQTRANKFLPPDEQSFIKVRQSNVFSDADPARSILRGLFSTANVFRPDSFIVSGDLGTIFSSSVPAPTNGTVTSEQVHMLEASSIGGVTTAFVIAAKDGIMVPPSQKKSEPSLVTPTSSVPIKSVQSAARLTQEVEIAR